MSDRKGIWPSTLMSPVSIPNLRNRERNCRIGWVWYRPDERQVKPELKALLSGIQSAMEGSWR